jgi:Fe-coproporphyrin III synthase
MELPADNNLARRSGTLMLHLLGRCNLECLHCYMGGSPSRSEMLPLAHVLDAVGECESLDIGTLYLTGGEPLLYRGLDEVLAAAAEVPALQITLCTNAMLVTQRRVELFLRLGVQVNVSVDGEQAFHDHFRKREGAFRATENGVRAMTEAGVPVTIVTTISRDNLRSLPSLVEWAKQAGAVEIRVQPLLRLGRGTAIADRCLSVRQTDLLLLQLSDLANLYRPAGFKCSLVGMSRRFLMAHPCGAYVCNGAGCHRRVSKEIKKLVVREDGTVLPEATNLSREFALGKFGDAPLSKMVGRFFEDGYERFDRLCRDTYSEVIPDWPSAFVPWDQILAERSRQWVPRQESEPAVAGCGSCPS